MNVIHLFKLTLHIELMSLLPKGHDVQIAWHVLYVVIPTFQKIMVNKTSILLRMSPLNSVNYALLNYTVFVWTKPECSLTNRVKNHLYIIKQDNVHVKYVSIL